MRKLLLSLFMLSTSVLAAECPNTDFSDRYLPTTDVHNIYCYEEYVLNYDYSKKTAVYVGEHLHPRDKFWPKRMNSFAANKAIPKEFRTNLSDYAEPKYDRGHLAPSGDMTSAKSGKESFLMSNMVPQTKQLNRGIWSTLEENLRKLSRTNNLYVITGPIYTQPLSFIGKGVPVPSAVFKWVYNTTNKEEYGYVIPNGEKFAELSDYQVSKKELEALTGLKLK